MSKNLIFLISFVLVLGLAGSAWAYPLDEAVGVWHMADDNDAAGPPFTNISADTRYVDFVDVTGTGIDGAVDFDGWALPSIDLGASYTELESPFGDELQIDGAVSILARVKMADWADGIEVVAGLYDGGCGDTVPSYGIEFQDFGHPTFAVAAAGTRTRVEVSLSQAVQLDTWYDIIGIFDPNGGKIRLLVFDAATGSMIDSNTVAVGFTSLDYPDDVPEFELFVSPCLNLPTPIDTAFIELVAIWPKVVSIEPRVSNSSPTNREGHARPDTELCFQAPALALCIDPNADPNLKGPFEYDVWFGSDPCTMFQIVDACLPASCNDVMCFDPCASDLDAATWYYWRVDINDLNGPGNSVFYTGPLFSFRTWGLAYDPEPANGATDIYPPVLLEWTVDGYAASSDVYFGTDATAVANANTNSTLFKGNQPITDVNYITGMIDLGKSFYWRIDEVNGVTIPAEEVWTFRTGDHYEVDTFDSYANQTALWNVWDDYWTNSTGSEVFVEADVDLVRDGNSLMYKYDCAKPYNKVGSRIDADIADLPIGPDWTTSGVKALVLYFYGQATNSATANDRMWVELEDTSSNAGVVLYDGDPNDVQLEQWNEWNIDMAIFDACGVSLTDIDKIHIGFGGPPIGQSKDGGSGTVYFDDIGIYASRCVPGLTYSLGDISADCNIGLEDVEVMGADWLDSDTEVPPAEPCDANLIVHYPYDTDGDFNDASGPPYYHGQPGSGASVSGNSLQLDGSVTSYVEIPFGAANPFDGSTDFSIAMWFKTTDDGILISSSKQDPCDVTTAPEFYDRAMSVYPVVADGWVPGKLTDHVVVYENQLSSWTWSDNLALFDDQWHHAAITYDADGGWDEEQSAITGLCRVYVDGYAPTIEEALGAGNFDPNIPNAHLDTVLIGYTYNPGIKDSGVTYFAGRIDDVRIYDFPLEHSHILSLSGSTEKVYIANSSLANLAPKDPNLSPDPNLKYDAYDPNNPDIVNFLDYDVLADNWLAGPLLWPPL